MRATMIRVSMYDLDCHAQTLMKNLGITYQLAVPQSLYDCWLFFMCEYDPEKWDDSLTVINELDPFALVGHGLSYKDAENITKWVEGGL